MAHAAHAVSGPCLSVQRTCTICVTPRTHADGKHMMSNAVALAQQASDAAAGRAKAGRLNAGVPARTPSPPLAARVPSSESLESTASGEVTYQAAPKNLRRALQDMDGMKSDIAGMEAVLSAVKGAAAMIWSRGFGRVCCCERGPLACAEPVSLTPQGQPCVKLSCAWSCYICRASVQYAWLHAFRTQQARAGYYEQRSTMGRPLPRVPLRQHLKRRARELAKLRQEHAIDPQRAQAMAEGLAQQAPQIDFGTFFDVRSRCATMRSFLSSYR